MLKTATTKQFRGAVRKVCERKNISLGGSWTNITRGDESNIRTVGLLCYAANDRLAAIIEKELGLQGVTAGTHATDASTITDAWGYGRGGSYIRGTCVLG
jgi:hypothetical protein